MSKIIRSKLINKYHNDLLAGHFGVNKTRELIGRKYYWPSLKKDIESYIKEYDIYLASKTVKQNLYGDFQSLLIPTHQWKNLSIDFVTRLPISTNWKSNSYDFILVIVDRLTKMMHYELAKITINTSRLAEVIIDVVVQYHGLLDSIISDRKAILTSKFWSSLCYFLDIKRRLFIVFHSQIDG